MQRFLTLLVCTIAFLVGCSQSDTAIGIVSVSPEHSARLRRGDSVQLRIAASFSQSQTEGTARLYVQSGDILLGKDTASVFGHNGIAVLEVPFTVPSSGDLTVRVALFAPGEQESLAIDRFEYGLSVAGSER
jgi:hypothetical protein